MHQRPTSGIVTRFPLGQVVVTRGALAQLLADDILRALYRHAICDWGELSLEDKVANNEASLNEERVVSVYRSFAGTEFYIITEGDRSVTTILLPSEY